MAQKHKTKIMAKSTKSAHVKAGSKPAVKPFAAKSKPAASKPVASKSAAKSVPAKSKAAMPKPSSVKPQAARSAAKSQASTKSKVTAKPTLKAVKPTKAAAPAPVAKTKPAVAAKSAPKPIAAKQAAAPMAKARPAGGLAKQAAPQRAVSASLKPVGQKITAPVPVAHSSPVPASPKAIAEKLAARGQMAAQKKPVLARHGFKTNEFVVYPAHGVGRIEGIEEQEIAGMSLELFVITFDKEKLTLRVPTGKLESVGMRKLADETVVKRAIETLKGRARVKRTMWSRRAQEYIAKINSGDLISIAEVVRDLYRSEAQPEQSYSERQLYEDALERMAREIAVVDRLDERGAVQRIVEILSKSAKGRRLAAETAEAAAETDIKAA
jgi:CarD family transcriptional regulator